MRNLVPYVKSTLETASVSALPLKKVAFAEDVVCCCFANDELAAVHLWSPKRQWFSETCWPLPETGAECVNLCYDGVEEKVIAVFSNGDFVECRNGEAIVAGSLEAEIGACQWSPTGEMACVWLKNNEVLLLSTDFEAAEQDVVLGKHQISTNDFKLAEKHVSVGWGKRETQFQGRGFRKSQDPTVKQEIESRKPLTGSESQVSVSWRGDGQYVVVNTVVEGERALWIFNSIGELESVSEPAADLLGYVAWEPRGGLIATVRPNEVLFFERNGLKRYSFEIEDAADVKQLSWSANSEVLSVVHNSKVDLYTVKNWHWYRKNTLDRRNGGDLLWHPELPCTMGFVNGVDSIDFYTWRLVSATDAGLAAVIDTNSVKVTPLDRCGIPPPMSMVEHKLDSQPLAVAVKFPNTVAVSTNCVTRIFELVSRSKSSGVLELKQEIAGVGAKLLSFTPEGELVVYTGDSLLVGGAEFMADQVSVLHGQHYLRGSQLCSLDSTVVHDFGEPCTDFYAFGGGSYGLSRSQRLVHSSGVVVANGVTSMLPSGSGHLLYTTFTTLRFVHLDQPPPVVDSTEGEQVREIERGSLLVSTMPHKMAVVLQAPRGNLETIYPRMFVLGEVRRLIGEGNYQQAFQVCRAHRIDMNLLYDLNPEQFANDVVSVVEQLGVDIDLLLGSLQNLDVTKKLYMDTTKVAGDEETQVDGKVNKVLDLLRPHLKPQNAVTSWCLRQPPDYVAALTCASKSPQLIKHLLVLCDADTLYKTALGVYEPKLALVVAQQAQMDPKEYIPFLRARDTETTARCRFNIDLFLRKYESAVVHLIQDQANTTDDEISEFTIRHGLHSLALLELRKQPDAFKEAQNDIILSQAELWLAAARYVDAGVNFELLGFTERALDAYILGCSWRKAMSITSPKDIHKVAERLVETTEADKRFADCATICLQYLNDPSHALELFCQGNHFDEAVLVARQHQLESKLQDLLREGFGSFQELLADFSTQVPAQLKRLRQIRQKRKEDMLGFEKQPLEAQMDGMAIDDNLSVTGTEASTSASVYTRYTDKTGASTGTAATNATRRTLKNQRRQERKKARGKKGSVYEEDYLIASTTRLVTRLTDSVADLKEITVALTRCGLQVYATRLESEYTKVVNLLVESVDEIYVLDDEARVRFDSVGQEYIAEQPEKPKIPQSALHA